MDGDDRHFTGRATFSNDNAMVDGVTWTTSTPYGTRT